METDNRVRGETDDHRLADAKSTIVDIVDRIGGAEATGEIRGVSESENRGESDEAAADDTGHIGETTSERQAASQENQA